MYLEECPRRNFWSNLNQTINSYWRGETSKDVLSVHISTPEISYNIINVYIPNLSITGSLLAWSRVTTVEIDDLPALTAVYNRWTGLVDWTTGLIDFHLKCTFRGYISHLCILLYYNKWGITVIYYLPEGYKGIYDPYIPPCGYYFDQSEPLF